MSQSVLGDKVGATQSQISDWENGRFVPAVDIVLKIIEATKADVAEFFTAEEQERVALKPDERALLNAYRTAEPDRREMVELSLRLRKPKGK